MQSYRHQHWQTKHQSSLSGFFCLRSLQKIHRQGSCGGAEVEGWHRPSAVALGIKISSMQCVSRVSVCAWWYNCLIMQAIKKALSQLLIEWIIEWIIGWSFIYFKHEGKVTKIANSFATCDIYWHCFQRFPPFYSATAWPSELLIPEVRVKISEAGKKKVDTGSLIRRKMGWRAQIFTIKTLELSY